MFQARSVIIDPFANAFNFNASRAGHQSDIRTPKMTAAVFEGKYEIDSLCAFLKLSYWYWRSASDAIPTFLTDTWMKAIESTLATISTMQKDDGKSKMPPYLFQRLTTTASDTLAMDGRGPPVAVINGLSRSLFRPSDDAVTFSYNIPGASMLSILFQRHCHILLVICGRVVLGHQEMPSPVRS